ncbi:TPA: recombinase family protein [Bacillus pacificus]
MINNVAIYLRKSRKEDGLTDAETLKNHRQTLTSLADSKGWDYVIYQEVGSSASLDRPQLQILLERLPDYEAILVMDIDRLSRDRYDSAILMREFKRYNLKIVTADGRITDLNDDTDSILTGMQEVFADYEYKQISKRLIRGRRASAKAGNWASGRVPLGYNYVRETKRLAINEEEASIVRDMYSMYIEENASLRDIAISMNKRGRRGKNGKVFNTKTTQHILSNEVYIGVTSQIGHYVADTHDSIISKETFEKAQEIMRRRSQKGSRAKQALHGLSGIIHCGYCGKSHTVQTRTYAGGITARRVKGCYHRDILTGELCKNRQVPYDEMLQDILSHVEAYKEKLFIKIQKAIENKESVNDTRTTKLNSLKIDLEDIQKRIAKLNRLVLADALSEEEFIPLKKDLDGRKTRVTSLIEDLENADPYDVISEWEEMHDTLAQLSSGEVMSEKGLNTLLSNAILKVELFNRADRDENPRIHIHWR